MIKTSVGYGARIDYTENCECYKFSLIETTYSLELTKEKALNWLSSEMSHVEKNELRLTGKIFITSGDQIVLNLDSVPDSFLLVGDTYKIKIGRKKIPAQLTSITGEIATFRPQIQIDGNLLEGGKRSVEVLSNGGIYLYRVSKEWIEKVEDDDLAHYLSKLTLVIDGPPGSGKTSEIVKIIRENNDKRFLIVSMSNVAVDNVLMRLKDLNPLKVGIKKAFPNVKHVSEIGGELKERIVGMTLTSFAMAVKRGIVKQDFDYLVVDEASMVPFALGLMPFDFAEKVIVAGDNRQLRPIVFSTPPNTYPAWESLMSVAVGYAKAHGVYKYLNVQYRGRKEIYDVIAQAFYSDVGIQVNQYSKKDYNYPRRDDFFDEILSDKCAITWVQIGGAKEEWRSRSAYNEVEAALVALLYSRLKEAGLKDEDIGIITNFRAQAALLQRTLGIGVSHLGLLRTESDGELDYTFDEYVSTVDSFQGGERLVVLYSTVTSEVHKSLMDFRRINVALSRAKEKLVIITSLNNVEELPFLCFIRARSQASKCYYEVSVADLNQNSEFQKYIEKVRKK